MTTKSNPELLVATDDTCWGATRINGSRITTALVWGIVRRYGRAEIRRLYDWPHISDEAIDAAIEWEREARRRPMREDDLAHLIAIGRALLQAKPRKGDGGQPEYSALKEALDLVCDRMQIDDIDGLLAVVAMPGARPAIDALRAKSAELPAAKPKRKGQT